MNFHVKLDMFSDVSDFDDDDNLLVQSTQEVEAAIEKERFAAKMDENDINQMVINGKSANTAKKTKWAVKLFNTWRAARNRKHNSAIGELLSMSVQQLNDTLRYFVAEVRNLNGKDYRPNTLCEIASSIQHFLRENGRFVRFADDSEFAGMREALDGKMKELTRKGVGLNRKQADIITADQEESLWQKGILGTDTPTKLLDTLLYSVGLNFALRAGQEHRNLRTGIYTQLKIKVASDGHKFLEYTEDVSKTNSGGLGSRKVKAKVTRAYENREEPDRCIVRIFEKYMGLRYV
jgi:hypothetical protein